MVWQMCYRRRKNSHVIIAPHILLFYLFNRTIVTTIAITIPFPICVHIAISATLKSNRIFVPRTRACVHIAVNALRPHLADANGKCKCMRSKPITGT